MCLRAGVLPLSYSSFVPSMNCFIKDRFVQGSYRHTGTACPLSEFGGCSHQWLLPLGIVQSELFLLDLARLITPTSDFVLRLLMLAHRVLRAAQNED